MTEKVTKKPEENGEETARKPAAKKPAEKQKVGLGARIKNHVKRNKRAYIAGLGGFATGVGAAVGAAEVGKRVNNRRKERKNVYIPAEPQDYTE